MDVKIQQATMKKAMTGSGKEWILSRHYLRRMRCIMLFFPQLFKEFLSTSDLERFLNSSNTSG
jgi:hypothetical protein